VRHLFVVGVVFIRRHARRSRSCSMAWNPPANTSETSADVPGKQGRTRGYSILNRGDRVTEFGGEIPSNPAGHHMYIRSQRVFSYEK
jgi:hypothetical protein